MQDIVEDAAVVLFKSESKGIINLYPIVTLQSLYNFLTFHMKKDKRVMNITRGSLSTYSLEL